MYKINDSKIKHSPRALKFWECCLAIFYENLSRFRQDRQFSDENDSKVNINDLIHNREGSSFYLDRAFDYYVLANKLHRPSYEFENKEAYKNELYQRTVRPKQNRNKPHFILKQEFIVNNSTKLLNPKIAVANTKVLEENIKKSLRGTPNFEGRRFDTLYRIFQQTKEEKADILIFPECFVPIELLDRITWYAVNEQKLVITGLEHISIDGVSFNFIVTILPFEKDGIKDAVVVFRLKNHYSHAEVLMINTNHYKVPHPTQYIYDLFIWRGIYLAPYYCFELADVKHRSLFKGKIDLLIASEWNSDTNYFSNIVESISRDLHVYVAQVNTSQFGDTRITQPSKTERKDILKLKGGDNDTILVSEINLKLLREFQRKLYMTTKDDKRFKPLPPEFSLDDVLKRINNESVL
ncbi:hypothetical protein [Parapedobacter sp. 10938]|uniref:hypothetical protein n=1 Tax=Parapedobacter flavus TaxID=3110225 RepID=UPI002DC004A1|nr:hypothetical protein [Parapedobacter sp. 10938]MEC3880311.1 hypothetical protein [Parapedobacter sp. 10938]